MTSLVQYAQMVAAIEKATRVDEVLSLRRDIAHLKLHADLINNRELMSKAAEYQLRSERKLGELLEAATAAGELQGRGGRRRRRKDDPAAPAPAKLADIGVNHMLSARAKRAAAMPAEEFELTIGAMRERMAAGKAIIVDPIKAAAKDAEIADRRAAHAARTINGGAIGDLAQMVREGRKFGSIGSDPQWKFITRSAAGDGRSANVHYKTEEVDKIKNLPVGQLLADDGAFYMWMVDWCPQDAMDLLAHYGLRHVTTAFTWIKTNGADPGLDIWDDSTWAMGQGYWTRANPEVCWLATKGTPKRLYADVRQLIVAPLMEHSRKPDAWLDRIERLTPGDYLELQARRTRPGWVSWGDELEFTGVAA